MVSTEMSKRCCWSEVQTSENGVTEGRKKRKKRIPGRTPGGMGREERARNLE
jgi:hypothetical protein